MFLSDLFSRCTLLIVVFLAISTQVDAEPGKTETANQLSQNLSDRRAEVRRRAAADLSELGYESIPAVPALSAALKDDDAAVRSAAAVAISRIGPEAAAAVPNLMLLLKDQDPSIRERALIALETIGPGAELAIEALREALKDEALDNSPRAANALGRIGEPAIPVLIEAMRNHPNVSTRSQAMMGLRALEPKTRMPIPALAAALRDPYGFVRRHACWVLGSMGADAKEALPALRQRLRDENLLEQFEAAEAMLRIDPSAAEPVEVLKSEGMLREYPLYAASALALVATEAETASPVLMKRLDEEEAPAWSQAMAIVGVGRLGPKSGAPAVPKLQTIARNGEGIYRLLAAETLVTLTGKPDELLTVIEQELLSPPKSSERRASALKALARLGPQGRQLAGKVIPLLKDNDWEIREAARAAMKQIDKAPRAADAPARVGQPANRDPYFTPTAAKSTPFMPQVIIRNIREDRVGNIWFATFAGPIRYDGKDFTNFAEEVGLPKTRVFSLLEDRKGALWFGSITGGASRYDGKSFKKFTEKEGLGNNDVVWIFEDRDANIWFATGNGVSRYNGKSMTNFTTKDGLVDNSVYTIAQDSSGRMWFGTQGGVCSYDGKSFSNLADRVGRSFVNVRAMVVDRSGILWFGGQEGAFRYDGKTLTSFTSKDGLLDDFVGSMIIDRAGNIWLGHPGRFPDNTGGGASRYDGKSFKQFTQKDGLGSATVYSMLEDRAGNVWFGSVDAGACRYDGKTFTYFSKVVPPLLPPGDESK